MAKKTLLFSNTVGDVTQKDVDIRFNAYMEEYLMKNTDSGLRLVFVDAPGLGGEDNYLPNILNCFAKIGINFADVIKLGRDTFDETTRIALKSGGEKVYFLTGGNPLTQMEIIKKFNLTETIRDHEGLVIGFCAGAINLSRYSIITSDEDFDKPQSYEGINRVPITIEPHYNNENDEKRNAEIREFAEKYHETIYAIPDESVIVVEDQEIKEFGNIYHF
ncbi:MAG: Type 1 glutamine amidotransferase-like domain-containing protein [Candidatus Saccharibacteria bacterium]|nr:Type 1 glutamine amidotransferase-like domain-containing protein [Candidatus Saccharibacteria bacterium]